MTAFHLDATNATNFLLATRLELRPGDVIFVAERQITSWNRAISQILPSVSLANALRD
jgi:polysaccharide export outer membrane protein